MIVITSHVGNFCVPPESDFSCLDLVEASLRDPFSSIGKPEGLKHLGANIWSRRVTQEHRLVYLVRDDRIDFLQARYHYA